MTTKMAELLKALSPGHKSVGELAVKVYGSERHKDMEHTKLLIAALKGAGWAISQENPQHRKSISLQRFRLSNAHYNIVQGYFGENGKRPWSQKMKLTPVNVRLLTGTAKVVKL